MFYASQHILGSLLELVDSCCHFLLHRLDCYVLAPLHVGQGGGEGWGGEG